MYNRIISNLTFLNNEARNLFKNMINHIFENVTVPVKHFYGPGVAK